MTPAERYLAELDAALRVPRRDRRRIVAEVREHLLDAERAEGDAERAVARMGPPDALAAEFVAQLATAGTRRAALTVAIAVAVVVGACGRLALLLPPALADFPHGALTRVAIQVSAVAVAVTVVRSLRWRRAALIPLEHLRPMVAGGLVAIGVLLADALVETALTIGSPSGARAGTEALALCVLLAAMLALGAASATRSLRRLAAAQRTTGAARPAANLVDDLLALGVRVPRPLDLRARPWRAALLAALVAGAATTLFELRDLPLGGALTTGAFEAAAVLAAFAAFGGVLGLRPASAPRSAARRTASRT